MNGILFDDHSRFQLLPLTYTRPIAELRPGIFTLREKWNRHIDTTFSTLTVNYLQEKFPVNIESDNLLVQGGLIPTIPLVEKIQQLSGGESLIQNNRLLATRLSKEDLQYYIQEDTLLPSTSIITNTTTHSFTDEVIKIEHWYDLFAYNDQAIRADTKIATNTQSVLSESSRHSQVIGESLYMAPTATALSATLNTKEGPIYIGPDTEIMEGSHIRGPCAIGNNSVVKMGAKIYGATTIGPYSKVGGEINNAVITGYSNKGHDGFLGNSVLGKWCNIGADTNNSNLKNNYGPVKVWEYEQETFSDTGLQFCGLVMGDHSKCAINTMFNTGTTIGVSTNIFNAGFPRRFIPSFSWGGARGFSEYKLEKAFETAERVKPRRNKELTKADKKILENVFKLTAKYRT